MGNHAYFGLLAALLLAALVAGWLVPFGWNQWIWAIAGLVFYLWCKDVFAGSGWRASRVPAVSAGEAFAHDDSDDDAVQSSRLYYFSAEELAALPDLSADERAGYQELVRLCVAAEDQAETLAFIDQLKDFGYAPHYPSTLQYVCDASDAAGWYFITVVGSKYLVDDLQLVLKTALWPQCLAVAWPDLAAYAPRTPVSAAGVWADFDRSLRAVGWQLGFLETDADEYVFVVHRVADAPAVRAAVQRIGYRYFEV